MQFTEEEAREIIAALPAQACQYARIENQYRAGFGGMSEPAKAACDAEADRYRVKRHAVHDLIGRFEYVGGQS